MALFWFFIAVICIAAELHTNAFIAFFIAVGSAVAFVLALLGVPLWIQFGGWAVVSVLGILTIRPFAVKRFRITRTGKELTEPTVGPLSGKTGMVEVAVGDALNPGRVLLEGQSWKAVTTAAAPLAAGTAVVVDKVQGTTLWVTTPQAAAAAPAK